MLWATGDDLSATFQMLRDKDCSLALSDATYETKESKGTWCLSGPSCTLRSKMSYASSKDATSSSLQAQAGNSSKLLQGGQGHCPLAGKLGAVLSSSWRASLREPPPVLCLEHLAAPNQTCLWGVQAAPHLPDLRAGGIPARGGLSLHPVAKQAPTPEPSTSLHA